MCDVCVCLDRGDSQDPFYHSKEVQPEIIKSYNARCNLSLKATQIKTMRHFGSSPAQMDFLQEELIKSGIKTS